MRRVLGGVLAVGLVIGLASAGRAQDAAATAVVDRAIQALGGAERLEKVKAASWTAKGTVTVDGDDHAITQRFVIGGLGRLRQEFELQFGGMDIRAVTVLSGDKAWRSFMGGADELDKALTANEKRMAYLNLVSLTVLPLKGSGFKLETIPDETIDGKAAAGLKVIPPDGKELRMYFDKESGLPLRTVAKVLDFMGEEYTQETNYSDYRLVDGIRKAMHVLVKRNGEKFLDQQISEFKALEQADPKEFEQPK